MPPVSPRYPADVHSPQSSEAEGQSRELQSPGSRRCTRSG